MPAASEVPPQLKPKPTKTVDAKAFKAAITTLRQLDGRIPKDVTEKAIHLLFSTNLLPGYDLSQAHVIELPSTNVYSLILPLTPSSRYQMPRPFKGSHNHTWALLHGINIGTSQIILLEGKNQTGQLAVQQKSCQMRRTILWSLLQLAKKLPNTDIDIPQWATKELMGHHAETWRRPTGSHRRCDVHRCMPTHGIQSWRQRDGTDPSGRKRSGHHVGEVHDCPQPSCGLEVRGSHMEKPAISSRCRGFLLREPELPYSITERTKDRYSGHRDDDKSDDP